MLLGVIINLLLQLSTEILSAMSLVFMSLQIALLVGFHHIIIENDNNNIISAIDGFNQNLLTDCLSFLQELSSLHKKFISVEVYWIPRELNVIAHNVAFWAKSSNNFGSFLESYLPSLIYN